MVSPTISGEIIERRDQVLIGRRSLLFDLALAPAVVAGALLGQVVLRRMPQAIFDKLVMALTVCAAGLLLVH